MTLITRAATADGDFCLVQSTICRQLCWSRRERLSTSNAMRRLMMLILWRLSWRWNGLSLRTRCRTVNYCRLL